MIEIIPDKPEITDELALSAARILKTYCEGQQYCTDCPLDMIGCSTEKCPYLWNIPERDEEI